MKSLNKALIIGYVGIDPEIRYSAKKDNLAYTTLSVATHSTNKDRTAQWHKVKLFGQRAEFARDYVKKGALCFIQGRIEHQSYIGKDGTQRYTTAIIADEINLLQSARSSLTGEPAEINPFDYTEESFVAPTATKKETKERRKEKKEVAPIPF